MKKRVLLIILVITVLALASAGMAQEVCSAQTVKGTYAITCSGWAKATPAPDAPLVPYAAQGTFSDELVDGLPVSNGSTNESIGGTQLTATYRSTSAQIKSNCTGELVFHITYSNGLEFPAANITFVILDQGKEVRTFPINQGDVITCTMRLMSRNTN